MDKLSNEQLIKCMQQQDANLQQAREEISERMAIDPVAEMIKINEELNKSIASKNSKTFNYKDVKKSKGGRNGTK